MIVSGEAFALLAAVFFAGSGVAVAKGVAHGSAGGDHGALLSILITATLAAVLWWIAPDSGVVKPGPALAAGVGWFALSGVLTVFLGRTLLYQSVASVGAIRATMMQRLNPFFSVLLAGVVLGERIGGTAGSGMLLILSSFALLVYGAFNRAGAAFPHEGSAGWVTRPSPRDYAFGPASAFSYALGNVARKHALTLVPDSNFGTLVSALAGLAGFLIATLFVPRYAASFRGLLRNASRWQVAAGLLASAGQLSQFAAIQHIEVSRAVMITSSEIFLSMFLAVYVLRTEKRPDALTLTAAVIAMAGVALVAMG